MGKRRPSGDGMVRKREDGRWEGRIVVGHKENGDSIFRYVSAGSQKALAEKLHREMSTYRGVDLTENSRMTLGEWLDQWLEELVAPSVRESTLEGYRHHIQYHIKPRLGSKPISKITPDDVRKGVLPRPPQTISALRNRTGDNTEIPTTGEQIKELA